MNWDKRLSVFLGASLAAHILIAAGIWALPKNTAISIAAEISIELNSISAMHAEQAGRAVDTRHNPRPDGTQSANESVTSSDLTTSEHDSDPAAETELANHLLAALRGAVAQRFVYPPLARRYGWEGDVQLRLQIEADGHVNALRMLRSSGYAILDEHAMQILRNIGVLPQARAWLSGRAYELDFKVIYRLTES